jgi:hypothetical protein
MTQLNSLLLKLHLAALLVAPGLRTIQFLFLTARGSFRNHFLNSCCCGLPREKIIVMIKKEEVKDILQSYCKGEG